MADLITDKSFDLNNTSEYSLSIQVNLDGFSFIITDFNNQNLVAFNSEQLTISSEAFLARRLAEWIESQGLLKQNYKQVKILYHSEHFTLIPEAYYKEEKNHEIFNLLFGYKKIQIIKVNTLPWISSKMLFSIPDDFETELSKIYANFSIAHPLELLFQNKPKEKDSVEGEVLLLFNSKTFFILIFNDNKLLVANSYQYFHFNDILYFVQSNLVQCKLEPNNIKLFLANSVSDKNQIKLEVYLKKYFGSVELLKTTLDYDTEIFYSFEHISPLQLLR